MEQYINKSDLLTKIEKRQNILDLDNPLGRGGMVELECLKDTINTMEVIEVKEVDLDEEIKSYFKGFGKFPSVGIDDCIDIAKHFYELGLKAQKGE